MQLLEITAPKSIKADKGQTMSLPPDIGRGGVMTLTTDSGIQMILSDYTLNSAVRMEYHSFPPAVGLGFCISGEIANGSSSCKNAVSIRSGQSALFRFESDEMWETVSTKRVIRLNIMLKPERFQSLLEKDLERAFPALHEIAGGSGRIDGTLTPAMRSVFLQILDCPYLGMTRDIFMESKALELIALKLDSLGGKKARLRGRPGLKDEEVDRTRYAAQLMTRDLENPLSIAEVAIQAGMCRSKLHNCFLEVYGMTPFNYLRHKRLEKAERLLSQGRMNVTQTAYAVGYSSLSHFSKAFQQHTGYLPGQRQKKRRGDATNNVFR